MSRQDGNRAGWGVAQAAMLGIGILTLYPLYFILITAFKTRDEYLDNKFLPPSDPTLENVRAAFRDGELLRWIVNSAGITIASVAVAAVVASLAAYPLARHVFPGRRPFMALNVMLLVVPPVVLVVPLFLFFIGLGMVNSRLAVIIIYIGLLLPFSIYLLVNFFATIPRSLEEAARIDGAGHAAHAVERVRAAVGAGDRDDRGGQRRLGLERAADRPGLPAGRRRAAPSPPG